VANPTPYGRHYCTSCGDRVFPGDTFEMLTEAPAPGARGNPILLRSANQKRRKDNPDDLSQIAWCWRESKWVETVREDRNTIALRYLKRKGVTFHFEGDTGVKPPVTAFPRHLEARQMQARSGSAIIRLPKRRRDRADVPKRRRGA
jgi:hypothetical protein